MVYKKKANTKSKRWYFDARIGRNVPIVGGSGFTFGTTPPQKRAIKAVVKRELQNAEESKRYVNTHASTTLTHNTIYTWAPFQGLNPGVGVSERIGSSIYAKALKIRGYYRINTTIPNAKLRIMVLTSDVNLGVGATFGSGLGTSDLFIPGSTGNVQALGLVNLKDGQVRQVLCDKTISLELQEGLLGSTNDRMFEMTCWLNKKVDYETSGYNKSKNYYIIIIPYIPGGVTAVTTLPEVQLTTMLTYKDA